MGQHPGCVRTQCGVTQRTETLPDHRRRDAALDRALEQVEGADGLCRIDVGDVPAADGEHERGALDLTGEGRVDRFRKICVRRRGGRGVRRGTASAGLHLLDRALAQVEPGRRHRADDGWAESGREAPGRSGQAREMAVGDGADTRQVRRQQRRGAGEDADGRAGPAGPDPAYGHLQHGEVTVVAQPVLAVLQNDPLLRAWAAGRRSLPLHRSPLFPTDHLREQRRVVTSDAPSCPR